MPDRSSSQDSNAGPSAPTPSAPTASSLRVPSWVSTSQYLSVLAPGAAQGATTVLLGHPFDTAKTRLQADTTGRLGTRSAVRLMSRMVREEGPLALYRGVTPPLIVMGSKRSIQFALFESIKSSSTAVASSSNALLAAQGQGGRGGIHAWSAAVVDRTKAAVSGSNFLSGAVSGAIGTVLGCPMHVLKIQTQNVVLERRWNAALCLRDILRRDGPRGLYRGFRFHILKDTLFAGTYLGLYRSLLQRYDPPTTAATTPVPKATATTPLGAGVTSAAAAVAPAVAASQSELELATGREQGDNDSCLAPPTGRPAIPTLRLETHAEHLSLTSPSPRTRNLTVFSAGVAASFVTWTLLYPLDTLKTTVQARNEATLRGFAAALARHPAGAYRGLVAALVRAGPVSGVAMVAYEAVKRQCVPPPPHGARDR